MSPEQLAEQLRQALGERLKSVVLYGSAAVGDFIDKVSRFDVLVVVDPVGMSELNAMMPVVVAWSKSGQPAPQIFSPAQLTSSADTFAIELSDMRQSRKVLVGADLLAELKIERPHLRLQLERELKGKLLALRRKYLLTAGQRDAVMDLIMGSLSTFLVLCRATLRLFDENCPAHKHDALQRLKEHIAFDPQPFFQIEACKRQGRATADIEPEALFASYLKSIETIVAAIDHM